MHHAMVASGLTNVMLSSFTFPTPTRFAYIGHVYFQLSDSCRWRATVVEFNKFFMLTGSRIKNPVEFAY